MVRTDDIVWFEFVESKVSSSCRYLYLYLEHAGRIHLLYLFSKGEQADLSPDQTHLIAALSQQIKREREA